MSIVFVAYIMHSTSKSILIDTFILLLPRGDRQPTHPPVGARRFPAGESGRKTIPTHFFAFDPSPWPAEAIFLVCTSEKRTNGCLPSPSSLLTGGGEKGTGESEAFATETGRDSPTFAVRS